MFAILSAKYGVTARLQKAHATDSLFFFYFLCSWPLPYFLFVDVSSLFPLYFFQAQRQKGAADWKR